MKQGTVGTYGSESLPNITTTAIKGFRIEPSATSTNEALSLTVSSGGQTANGAIIKTGSLSFDASISSSTYQNNAKVNPDNAEILYVIKY